MNKFKLIPDWIERDLKCHFCGETKSVKYQMTIVVSGNETQVCVCNRCVTLYKKE